MMIVIKIKTVYHLLILCAKCVPKLSKLVIPCENKKSQILVYQGFVIHRDCSTIIYYGDDVHLKPFYINVLKLFGSSLVAVL